MPMTAPKFIHSLPERLRTPLRLRDFSALLLAAEDMATQYHDTVALALWRIAALDTSSEAYQVFSYCLVRTLTGPIAEAGRLWLMVQPTDDISTLINILSGIESAVVEGEGLPDYQLSVLPDFLLRCLEHPAESVRISVLDFLRNYTVAQGLPRRFGRTAAWRLAKELERRLSSVVIEEEIEELGSVIAGLNSDVIPLRPPIRLNAINDVIEYLEKTPDAGELFSFVKVRRLRDDAKRQAQHSDRPIITIRILDKDNGNKFLDCIRTIFNLCRFENVDPTDKVWVAAPAASTAAHLLARSTTTKETFRRFRLASAIADHAPQARSAMAELPPRQADAIAKLLVEASQSDIKAEFMLTSAEVGDSQEIISFRGATESSDFWMPAALQAERAANERPEVYSDEVPQANTVRQVIQAVIAILQRGKADIGDIDNIGTGRQISYYTSAARSLGFLTEELYPTDLGFSLQGKNYEQQMELSAAAFCQSMVGRAWRAWAAKSHLADVQPLTAEEFLHSRAIGLSGSTIPRRASTLRKWQVELLPFYRR